MATAPKKQIVTDYNAFAAEQKEMYGKVASFGAIGGLLGVGLGNHFSFNVFYAGMMGFLVGAAIGKSVHNSSQKKLTY